MIRDYYTSEEDRQAGIEAGQTSARRSTVHDGQKHYAVVRNYDGGGMEIARNLTHTDADNVDDATRLAQRLDHGPFGDDVAGYHAHRIA